MVIDKKISRSRILDLNKDVVGTNKIYGALTSRTDQHRLKQNEETVENYSHVCFDDVADKPLNTIQKIAGVDTPSHMKGEVAYLSLCIVHIPFA